MNTAQLKQFVDSLEGHAGAVTTANANDAGYWRRAYLAAETLAGATTSANDNTEGYILRTTRALEAVAGTSGAEENASTEGHLERIADALEALGSPVSGSIDHRLITSAAAAVFFTPAALFGVSDTGAFFDVSDLSSMRQGDTLATAAAAVDQPVGYLGDKSGKAKHATQATLGFRPILRQDAEGKYCLEFDGVDDRLVTPAFACAVPFERYSAIQQITWTASDRFFSGAGVLEAILYQANGTPQVVMFGSLAAPSAGNALAVGVKGVVRELWNTASTATSAIQINNEPPATGNPGTGTAITNGVSIGGGSTGSNCSNFRFYGATIISRVLSAGDATKTKNYHASKMGVTL